MARKKRSELSPEELEKARAKQREHSRRYRERNPEKVRERKGWVRWRANLTDERKAELRKRARERTRHRRANMTEDQKARERARGRRRWANRTEEQKARDRERERKRVRKK